MRTVCPDNAKNCVHQQPVRDGGIGHLDVKARLRANWTGLIMQLCQADAAPWKNIWWHAMRARYGDLATSRLVFSKCSFHLLRASTSPASPVCKLAFEGWAELPGSRRSRAQEHLAIDPSGAP